MMIQSDLQQLLNAAAQAQRGGRTQEANRLCRDVLGRGEEQPLALNILGMQALAANDPAQAAGLFCRAIAVDPAAPELYMNLARAYRLAGDDARERDALQGALAIDRRHFMALVRMAELLERLGDEAQAAEHWSGVLAMAAMLDDRSPTIDAMLDHARDYVLRQQAMFATAIDTGLAAARAALPARARRRFDACIDATVGRRQIYANHCAGLHFPFLPADEFFERDHFPWLGEIEAQTDVIRGEFQALIAADAASFLPYVAMEPGTPTNKWSALDHQLDWSAFHLWKNGQRDDAACARCPQTVAALERLPLCDLPGRAPTIFFSVLKPGAHLPAHTGVSNVRAIVHLPLIVPPGCSFRVGGETRDWKVGEAWAFDDTIEHEAWNRSDAMRAILIFDVWNPHIDPTERDLLRQFFPLADANGNSTTSQLGD